MYKIIEDIIVVVVCPSSLLKIGDHRTTHQFSATFSTSDSLVINGAL